MAHLIAFLCILFWFVLGWCACTWMDERTDFRRGHDSENPACKYWYFAIRIRGRWRRFCLTFETDRPVK